VSLIDGSIERVKSAFRNLVAQQELTDAFVVHFFENDFVIIASTTDVESQILERFIHSKASADLAELSYQEYVLYDAGDTEVATFYFKNPSLAVVSFETIGEINPLREAVMSYCLSEATAERLLVEAAFSTNGGTHDDLGLSVLVKQLGFKCASLWLFHNNKEAFDEVDYLTIESTVGHDVSEYESAILPRGHGIVWRSLEPGAPREIVLDNVSESQLVNRCLLEIFRPRTVLVRLESNGVVFGVVCLNAYTTKQTINHRLIRVFEDVGALALKRKQDERNGQVLGKISNLIPREHRDLRSLCRGAVASARLLLSCEACSLFLARGLEPKATLLDLIDLAVAPKKALSTKAENFLKGKEIVYPVYHQSLTSGVYRSKKPRVSNKVSSEKENSHLFREIADEANQSWIGVPIFGHGNECIGVLRCTGKFKALETGERTFIFNRDDCDILQHFSRILGPVIEMVEKANILDKTYQSLEESERIREHEILGPLTSIAATSMYVAEHIDDKAYAREKRLRFIKEDAEMCAFLLIRSTLGSPERFEDEMSLFSVDKMFAQLRDFLVRQVYIRSKIEQPGIINFGDIERLITPSMTINVRGQSKWFYGHEMLLKRAFYNIASNALKYGKPHGHFNVLYGEIDNELVVSLRDDGIGIDPEDKKKIFERHYRGKIVREDRRYPGTGLGLFIVSQIVDMHGGSVELVSCRNDTEFEVRLPFIRGTHYNELLDSAKIPKLPKYK